MVKKLQLDESKLKKLQELKELKINPYPYSFKQSDHAQDLKHKYAHLGIGDHTKDLVSVAGRVMLKRVMGKASFMQILDQTGVIQLYLAQDILGEKNYDILIKKTDNGDILGVEGIIFKTKTGEITVEVKSGEMLCKSLLPMPEKFHGLKDIELKYRQRYVDLFVNPETKEVFFKRSKIIQTVREYLTERGFLEVETPVLQTIYGGANAKPFITHINAWDMKMFLSISPELYLKRILVGGIERVFTICKNFRNEDVDPTHNPEFTMMECYQSYVDYEQTMQYVEEMYEKACIAANGSTQIKRVYKGEEVIVEFKAPWKRITMLDALKKYAKIDTSKMTEEHVLNLVEEHKIEFEGEFSWGKGVQLLFEELVEEKLVQPVHITDHPRESTPLCKAHRKDPRLIERFESYCLGVELSNGYSELNDPILQRELLEAQAKELRAGASEAHPMDEDFVNAMEYGMPPASGVGVGIDRMVIMLTGVDSIRDIIFFPTMKPVVEENEKKEGYNKSAIILVNKELNKQPWQELNTVAHLSAAFSARLGRQLFLQDKITTKDNQQINLNIQHAIMIKEADNNKEIKDLLKEAKAKGLEIAEFTTEMQETTSDKKVIAITREKDYSHINYLGGLIFGDKTVVDELTKKFPLHK